MEFQTLVPLTAISRYQILNAYWPAQGHVQEDEGYSFTEWYLLSDNLSCITTLSCVYSKTSVETTP